MQIETCQAADNYKADKQRAMSNEIGSKNTLVTRRQASRSAFRFDHQLVVKSQTIRLFEMHWLKWSFYSERRYINI